MIDKNKTTELPYVQNFFHDTGAGRIFCTLIGSADSAQECVIYFSPLFEERMWAQRIAYNFAIDLAADEKRAVLMFDYYGYGESDGDAEDFTLAQCRVAVESLLALLRKRGMSRFACWGIRTGCAVALASLPPGISLSSAYFWAPVFNLQEYVFDSLRATIAAQYMIFNKSLVTRDIILEELVKTGKCVREGYVLNYIEGYRFGDLFYKEVLSMGHDPGLDLIECPVLLAEVVNPAAMRGTKSENAPHAGKATVDNTKVSCMRVAERKFWVIGRDYCQRADALYNATHGWLESIDGNGVVSADCCVQDMLGLNPDQIMKAGI